MPPAMPPITPPSWPSSSSSSSSFSGGGSAFGVSLGAVMTLGLSALGFLALDFLGGGGGGGGGGGATDSVTSIAGIGISSTCQMECTTPNASATACSRTEKVRVMRRQPLGTARCWDRIASNAMGEDFFSRAWLLQEPKGRAHWLLGLWLPDHWLVSVPGRMAPAPARSPSPATHWQS